MRTLVACGHQGVPLHQAHCHTILRNVDRRVVSWDLFVFGRFRVRISDDPMFALSVKSTVNYPSTQIVLYTVSQTRCNGSTLRKITFTFQKLWAGVAVSRYSDSQRAGRGVESWWGARFSAPIQTGPGTHPASYTMGTGSLSRR